MKQHNQSSHLGVFNNTALEFTLSLERKPYSLPTAPFNEFNTNPIANSKNVREVETNASAKSSITKGKNNWCFIDMQNLYKGVAERGWKIDWKCFRHYLGDKLGVSKAILFMGYISGFSDTYNELERAGFVLEFRPVRILRSGKVDGGNVDADIAAGVMDHKYDYDQAIIVADDGDYYRTIQRLSRQNKLAMIISSHLLKDTSEFIKSVIDRKLLISIHALRNQIEKRQFSNVPNTRGRTA